MPADYAPNLLPRPKARPAAPGISLENLNRAAMLAGHGQQAGRTLTDDERTHAFFLLINGMIAAQYGTEAANLLAENIGLHHLVQREAA